MKVAVSLVNMNGAAELELCLESLRCSDLAQHEYEIYIYDNASSKETQDVYTRHAEKTKYIYRSNENDGIVKPRIHLYEKIRSKIDFDFLLEIHNDMLFPKKIFNKLFSDFREEYGIIMPHMITDTGRFLSDVSVLDSYCDKISDNENILFDTYPIHPWLVSSKVFDEVGYYDEKYHPARNEDMDFYYRVREHGFTPAVVCGVAAYHYGGYTRNRTRLGARNEDIFLQKHNLTVKQFYESLDGKNHYKARKDI